MKLRIRWIDLFTLLFMVSVLIAFLGYVGDWMYILYFIYWDLLRTYIADLGARKITEEIIHTDGDSGERKVKKIETPFQKRNGELWLLAWAIFIGVLSYISHTNPGKYTLPIHHLLLPVSIVFYEYIKSRRKKIISFFSKTK